MRYLSFSLYALALVAAVVLDAQFAGHHIAGTGAPGEVENIASKRYWDYLRLRDPATGEIPRGIHSRELAFARSIGGGSALKEASLSTIQTGGWRSAGPINAGGRTQAIGIDVSNEANVLLATAQGGVFRSTDSGHTWNRTTAPDQPKDLNSLVQDHRAGKTNTWFCGSGELLSTTDRRTQVVGEPRWRTTDIGDGIYKSTDDGKSWSLLPSTHDATVTTLDSAFDGVWNIVVDNSQVEKDIVYAAGFGAIMRSADGGATWSKVLGDPANKSFCTDIQITSKGILYAYLSQLVEGSGTSSTAGVWRSVDGVHWTNITPANWPAQTQRLKIAIAPSNENILYIAGADDGAGLNPILFKYTYKSGDGSGSGGSWEDRSQNLPYVDGSGAGGAATLGGYAVTLKVFPTNPNMVFFGGTNLLRSPDGFASTNFDWVGGYYWYYLNSRRDSNQSYPNHHPDNHDIAFLPSNPRSMFSANDGGIYHTYDCLATNADAQYRPIEWENRNTNDVASILYVVGINHGNPKDSTLVGGFQDQGSWLSNAGGAWYQQGGGDGCYCAVENDTSYYMSSQFGSVQRWLNVSGSWYITGIRPDNINDPQFVTPYILDPANTNKMYYAANDSLWRNDDLLGIPDGAIYGTTLINWTCLGQCTVPGGGLITALGMSYAPGHRLYFGTSDGHLYRVDHSDGFSPTPTEIAGSIFPQNAFISCVAVDPQNADSIVVCFSNYHVISLFASNNGGLTWRNVSGNLEQNPDGSGDGPSTRWVSIVHQSGQTIYLVGTSVGLFSTTDISGPSVMWTPEGLQTIGRAMVENIDARQSDGFVAIATQGSGVFVTNVIATPLSVVSAGVGSSRGFTISPNPASDRSVVSVRSDGLQKISLSVVDLSGRVVALIHDGEASMGLTNYSFDCSRLPSGSYYVELRTGEAVETKRLVVKR